MTSASRALNDAPGAGPAPDDGRVGPGLARVCILAAAILFSTGGAAIKATQLSGIQVASFRSLVAAAALLLFLPRARRGYRPASLLVGVVYAACMVLFVLANKLTTAANTIFLQSTAPLYVLVASPLLLREPVRRSDLIFIVTIACGLGLFFLEKKPQASAPNPMLGNILATVSGVCWAGTLMGLRGLSARKVEGLTAVVAGNLIAGLVCLPWALSSSSALPLAETHLADWLAVAYLGAVQIGLAYFCLTLGFRHVPALEASLLILLEPSLSPVWAYWLQSEVPGVWSIVGGLLVLGSSAARGWLSARLTLARKRVGNRGQSPPPPLV
ncbi:MAG: DMT family transporter [Polyangiaceae bacterium]